MKPRIPSDLYVEFEAFEVAKDLDYNVAVFAGDIMAPGREAASWLRDPAHFDDNHPNEKTAAVKRNGRTQVHQAHRVHNRFSLSRARSGQ